MKTLLVANRGVIASRVFRSAHALGIATVAVFSDADAELPYVAQADRAIRLPGTRAEQTYLSIDALLRAARASGADAVHPGYGFLAESADFAQACADAGLTFVGPTPAAIRAMGSKAQAKELAVAAGVAVLPSERYVPGDPASLAAIQAMGFPMLIKPSAGGGGKGMLRVDEAALLPDALDSARRQASQAFGDETLLIERYVIGGRHIEVQVLADTAGAVVHLGERECSVQRRHQKIVEESPSVAVDEALRSRLTEAALRLARAIDYVGVGTVEFLLEPDGNFWFLEMNTRLQVEHAVTEARTGLDLVELQLRVAAGEPLPFTADEIRFDGHAIEARLYAEAVESGFLPSAGLVVAADFSAITTARVEAGVSGGSVVSTWYDPMLAKLISWAPDRASAVNRLRRALRDTVIFGVEVNRDFLLALLDDADFRAGATTTTFVDEHPQLQGSTVGAEIRLTLAVAVAVVEATQSKSQRRVLKFAPTGWRNVGTATAELRLRDGGGDLTIGLQALESDRWSATIADVAYSVTSRSVGPDVVDIEVDGARRRCQVSRLGQRWFAHTADGAATFTEVSLLSDDLRAVAGLDAVSPLPGTVTIVAVSPGDKVAPGDLLVVIEAMKMEHRIHAATEGVVGEVRVVVGASVDAHQLLVAVSAVD